MARGQKRVNIEVDQSGKVERTNKDTVLAFSNGEQRAIRIPAGVKRAVLEHMQRRGRPRGRLARYLRLFVVGLYLLLRDHLEACDRITIDTEYSGQEALIETWLLLLARSMHPDYPSGRIVFHQVGRESPAHALAISVTRGERAAEHVVSEDELLDLL